MADECFTTASFGTYGPDCSVYLAGECLAPEAMIEYLDTEGLELHAELYPPTD
jgi:hypothetical protein